MGLRFPSASSEPHLFLRAERLAAGALRVCIILGILLRITRLRDRWHPLAIIFYSTPWPVLAFGLLILALHAARLRRWHHFRRYLILSGGALFTWTALSWYSQPPPSPLAPGDVAIKVVEWNVGRPSDFRFGLISRWLRAQDADIYALAEAQVDNVDNVARWQAAFPGYRVLALQGEMMCLVRGDLTPLEGGELGHVSFYGLSHARVRGRDLTLLQADIYAHPRWPRLPVLARLAAIAKLHARERLLVLGDFNTPRESVAFDQYRTFLRHAFETAGHGLAETWPTWSPALSLDHVWCSPSLPPFSAQIAWPLWSDHRPQIVELHLPSS